MISANQGAGTPTSRLSVLHWDAARCGRQGALLVLCFSLCGGGPAMAEPDLASTLPPSLPSTSNLTVTGSGAFRAAVENRSLLPVAVTLEGLELRHP